MRRLFVLRCIRALCAQARSCANVPEQYFLFGYFFAGSRVLRSPCPESDSGHLYLAETRPCARDFRHRRAMKRISYFGLMSLLGFILLAACAPSPTPAPTAAPLKDVTV